MPRGPPPTPARFLAPHHNDGLDNNAKLPSRSDELSSFATATGVDASDTFDVTDELDRSHGVALHFRETSANARKAKGYRIHDSIDHGEDESMLGNNNHRQTYPPRRLLSHTRHARDGESNRQLSGHSPIPAITVFSRHSAPTSLPQLDEYMSSLPSPTFSALANGNANGKVAMFSPLDLLASSGNSLEDLEMNRQVSPTWKNRTTLVGGLMGVVLGVLGSSLVSTYYSLHSLFNTVQIFALILNTLIPVHRSNLINSWKMLFLGTIPNVLALNFGTTLAQNVVLLLLFTIIAGSLMVLFYRLNKSYGRYTHYEGFQCPKRNNGWAVVIVTFLLTVVYLPLSTVAVHVITWSDELWVVPYSYVNSTTQHTTVVPLGQAAEYRSPWDFCWTTTMKKDELNYAPLIVIMAIALFCGLTLWFPFALHKAINETAPRVDPYTALGKRRTTGELDIEYDRTLDRDLNPLSFAYHGFRRGWASYEAIYLLAKLSALLIIAVISPNNCLFRDLPSKMVMLVRQIILLIGTLIFFGLQCLFAPFLNPLNNASEWMSRLNYVLTSVVALLVALDLPRQNIIDGPVLYIIYIITYGFSLYFASVGMGWVQKLVKRLTLRVDFSIDIFSPRLDLSSASPHLRRRIWQEVISVLILTDSECRIPKGQDMYFVSSKNSEYPPYLSGFKGRPGERHVENIKILREIGSSAYSKSSLLSNTPEFSQIQRLLVEIQEKFVGPDSYWHNRADSETPGMTRFGNAWLIPFPPTLVIRFDGGSKAVIQDPYELQQYIFQNSSAEVRRRREIRMALRALDGQKVYWPNEHIQTKYSRIWYKGSRYRAQTVVKMQYATLRIKRKGYLLWDGLQLGSGFDLELRYSRDVVHDGSIIGVNDNYDLTESLAQFLALNHRTIQRRLPEVTQKIVEYRNYYAHEFTRKVDTLGYNFLTRVYNSPKEAVDLLKEIGGSEKDTRVRRLFERNELILRTTYDRFSAVASSEVATWWYLFWDDLWRRNFDTIAALRLHDVDFNPHYPTSIAYTPLPRAALEAFLKQRGMLGANPQFLHTGFLNKIYIRMYDILNRGTQNGDIFHYGYGQSEADLDEIDAETRVNPSSLGTGNGTDYDDDEIRQRPYFRWEGIFSDPIVARTPQHHRMIAKLGAWLGIVPLWRAGIPSPGVSLDLRLENGRYVL